MYKIALAALLLVGCTPKDIDIPDFNRPCNEFCKQDLEYKERERVREEKLYAHGPKYKIPNQFTLKSGCIIRVVEDPKIIHWSSHPISFYYRYDVIVNEWTDDCSTIEKTEDIWENDISLARYK